MIEKKLNDKIEDTVASALKDELEQSPILEPVSPSPIMTDTGETLEETLAPVESEEVSVPSPEPVEVPPASTDDKVAVLGALGKLGLKLSKRVDEAERRATPGLDESRIIQEERGVIFVRGYTDEESERIQSALGGEYTKSLNFPAIFEGRVGGDFDLATYMAKFRDANAELIENFRRGKIPMERVIELAKERDMEEVVTLWLSRNPGQTSNVEDFAAGVLAIDRVQGATDELYRLAREAEELGNTQLADEYRTRAHQYISVMGEMLINLSGSVSEAARTTAAAGHFKRGGLPDVQGRSQQIINLLESPSITDIRLTEQAYMALDTRGQKVTFISKLAQGGAKTYQGMVTVWMNALLSAFPTHAINIAGNTGLQVLDLFETTVAGAIGAARTGGKALYGKATGTEVNTADRVYVKESMYKLKGIVYSLVDGLLIAGRTFKTGMPTDPVSKLDVERYRVMGSSSDFGEMLRQIRNREIGPAAANLFSNVLTLPGRALLTSDEFFKAIAYRSHVYSEALRSGEIVYQDALKVGRTPQEAAITRREHIASLIDNPTTEIKETAKQASKHLTLTEELKGFSGLVKTAVSYPFFKQVMPFATAPINDFNISLSRIPLVGFGVKKFRDDFMAGGARRDMALAKQTTASGIALLTMNAVSSNFGENNRVVVTGAGPRDSKAKAAWRRMGFQEYSFCFPREGKNGRVNNYECRSYARMGPFSATLAVYADYNMYSQYDQDYTNLNALAHAAILSTADYMLTQPYLQTLEEITDAMLGSDTESKINSILDKVAETQGDFILHATAPGYSSFGRSVTRTDLLGEADPTKYSTMIPYKGIIGEKVQDMPDWTHPFYSALQKMKAQSWYFSDDRENLYPQLNIWGEVREYGTGALHEAFNPFRIREAKFKILDEELVRLNRGLTEPKRRISGVPLTDQQYHRWVTMINEVDSKKRLPGDPGYKSTDPVTGLPAQTVKEQLLQLVTRNQSYQKLTDPDMRMAKIRRIYNAYKDMAWQKLLAEDTNNDGDLKRRIDSSKKPSVIEPSPFVREE